MPEHSRRSRPSRSMTKKQKDNNKLVTKRQVKRLIAANAEQKYYECHFDDVTSDYSAINNVYSLSSIPQGDDVGQRSGDKILGKMMELSITLKMQQAVGAPTAGYYRISVIKWKSLRQSAFIPSQVEIYNQTETGNVNYVNALFNYRDRDQFVVLYDKLHKFILGGDSQRKHIKIRKTLKSPLTFSGPTSAAYDRNSIWLITSSDNAAGALLTPLMDVDSCIFYTDS